MCSRKCFWHFEADFQGIADEVGLECSLPSRRHFGMCYSAQCPSHEEVENLLQVLRIEGLEGEVLDDDEGDEEALDQIREYVAPPVATEKWTELGLFLTMQRL